MGWSENVNKLLAHDLVAGYKHTEAAKLPHPLLHKQEILREYSKFKSSSPVARALDLP